MSFTSLFCGLTIMTLSVSCASLNYTDQEEHYTEGPEGTEYYVVADKEYLIRQSHKRAIIEDSIIRADGELIKQDLEHELQRKIASYDTALLQEILPDMTEKEVKIKIDVCCDHDGVVMLARQTAPENLSPKLKTALEATALNYRFEAIDEYGRIECGEMSFVLSKE